MINCGQWSIEIKTQKTYIIVLKWIFETKLICYKLEKDAWQFGPLRASGEKKKTKKALFWHVLISSYFFLDLTMWFNVAYFVILSGSCYLAFSSVQSLSSVQLFVTPWTTAHQTSLSITNSPSLLKVRSIESVMPSNHLILCHPLLLLPSIFPSIRDF